MVFNQRPTQPLSINLAVIHQLSFARSCTLSRSSTQSSLILHILRTGSLVKVTMLTLRRITLPIICSVGRLLIQHCPLKNIATHQHEIPLKLSVTRGERVDWKRGAGRMLAYINLSRCIEAMCLDANPSASHLRVIGQKKKIPPRDLSLSLFVGGTTTTLASDIIDHAGKERPSRIPVPLLTMIQTDLGPFTTPRPRFLSIKALFDYYSWVKLRVVLVPRLISRTCRAKRYDLLSAIVGMAGFGQGFERRGKKVICVTVFRMTIGQFFFFFFRSSSLFLYNNIKIE